MILTRLSYPIVQAPMGGRIATPQLALAVSQAGALGFLAGGPVSAAAVRRSLQELVSRTDRPYGINFWVPGSRNSPRARTEPENPAPGMPRPTAEDPDWDAKLRLALEYQTPVVSFSFGVPPAQIISELRDAGSEIWLSSNTPEDAWAAEEAGADVLILQGVEASPAARWRKSETLSLQSLIALTRQRSDLPIVGAGGIADGAGMAAALAATATAVQVGTALMLASEAGTSAVGRRELREPHRLAELRTVTGATSTPNAPSMWLEISDRGLSLLPGRNRPASDERIYAGQTRRLAREATAKEIIVSLTEDAYAALEGARLRLLESFDR